MDWVIDEIGKRGDVIYKFDQAEMDKLQGIADGVSNSWITTMEGNGLPGQKLYDALQAAIKKYA